MSAATKHELGLCVEEKCRARLHVRGLDVVCTRGHIQRDHPLALELQQYREQASHSSAPAIALDVPPVCPEGDGWRLDLAGSFLTSENGPVILHALATPQANSDARAAAVARLDGLEDVVMAEAATDPAFKRLAELRRQRQQATEAHQQAVEDLTAFDNEECPDGENLAVWLPKKERQRSKLYGQVEESGRVQARIDEYVGRAATAAAAVLSEVSERHRTAMVKKLAAEGAILASDLIGAVAPTLSALKVNQLVANALQGLAGNRAALAKLSDVLDQLGTAPKDRQVVLPIGLKELE
jgi:hypothetical protein